jgi:hypothetical protein
MQSRSPVAAIAVAILASVGCSRTVQVQSGGDVSNEVISANTRVLPAGALLEVQTDELLSANHQAGDRFTAHVVNPVTDQNGSVVVPAGAVVQGRVTGATASNDPLKPGMIRLDFESLSFNGRSHPFKATVERTTVPGRSNDDLLKKAGTGAAAGGVLGALGTDNAQARLPAGTHMTLRNENRVALR